jgi:RNA polymerase sigma-54 factor
MALTPRLDVNISQTLVMTPQLQQAIKLLQLSNVELTEFVETEMVENPLLEWDEGQDDNVRETDRSDEKAVAESFEGPDTAQQTGSDSVPSDGDAPLDTSYDNVYDGDGIVDVGGDAPMAFADGRDGRGGRRDFADSSNDFDSTIASEKSLREHLNEQLNVDIDAHIDKLIGAYLIEMLDESGWLTTNLDDVAAVLSCDIDRVNRVLGLLQGFDPPGIFARNLGECMALQLRELDRLDPAMQLFLDNLDMLAKHDLDGLMKICGVDADDLVQMISEIRELNPKPGALFNHEVTQTVTPDILMRPGPSGDWILELNPETLPRVLVNNVYHARIGAKTRTKAEKEYVTERFQTASWLVKSLDQRANTILKVSSEIVRQQDAFFRRGVEFLRPLVLRDIAEAIEMHESTVSRVTTNKYMMTPRGIFVLKYFFTSSITNDKGGEGHSAEAVRYKIKVLIDGESLDDVFSDDRIVSILREDGIVVARRTVAKYRNGLKIPSSVLRRRQKAMAL